MSVCFVTSNVISSSPPTRPFHWGLIKCMADTACRAGGNENRRAPLALTEGGPMKSAELKGSRSCSPRMRSRKQNAYISEFVDSTSSLSFSLSLSLWLSFASTTTCTAEQFCPFRRATLLILPASTRCQPKFNPTEFVSSDQSQIYWFVTNNKIVFVSYRSPCALFICTFGASKYGRRKIDRVR